MNLFPNPVNFIHALFIILGIWLDSKLFWMCIYQLRYGGNTGELYITGRLTKEDKDRLKNARNNKGVYNRKS